MAALITTLIDKQDNFEIIRDQIAAILLLEQHNQQVLAVSETKDPSQWALKVYSERSNPWEAFRDQNSDRTPIINVWYNNSNFDGNASNTVAHQKASGTFNIDCYGRGLSRSETTGHTPGDEDAALEAQRAMRLVRNILMAGQYTYLGLRGLVWKRWPQSINLFQPQQGGLPVENVVGARLALTVDFSEFSPQYVPETLELLSIDISRLVDGKVVLEADYDYT